MPFPQLHTYSAYSLLNSTVRISDYVAYGKAQGYQALALTDKNVLHGAVEFYEACLKAGIKPIIGLDLTYTPYEEAQSQLLLYACDATGFQQLMRLSSQRMVRVETALQLPEEKLDHLLAIVPLEGRAALLEDPALYQKLTTRFRQVYLGVAANDQTGHELAQQLKAVQVYTHRVRYLRPDEAFACEVLGHIEQGTRLELEQTTAREFLPAEEQVLASLAETPEIIAATQEFAQQISWELPLHQTLLPHYPTREPAHELLARLCWEALPQRVAETTDIYKERLAMELSVIHEMGFDDYFLIVWDVMAYAHRENIVTGAGRGSAAGSLVAYVLEITDVDPIQYDLLFERFLNKERFTMPDIDLDIPDNKREQILHYVREKYGQLHMAQIATFGTMAAKMALRDVARVFGLSPSESNRWSNAVPNALKMTLSKAYETSNKLQQLVNEDERNRQMFQVAQQLEGLPRHVSTHAAGVVLSDQNLLELVPLQAGSNDILLTQYTMNDVEKIGLLKMDFLGLRNLSIIDNTLQSIKRVFNEEVDLHHLPLDDPETLALFQAGATTGVFQFESSGIRNVLRKLGPTSIDDIAAVNALYRPGPMENIDLFIRRKKGLEPIDYPDPSLEPILKSTYGVIVYQEQIMQVAAKMAGFSLGQADILRRAVSKKKKDVLDEERQHFVNGALQEGYQRQVAERVYDYIERFANYGFNKSHAYAYSFVGYQMAYLKVHYPAPFYAALLHSVRHNTKKIKEYVNEARKNDVKILAPDINRSYYSFHLLGPKEILFGFSSLKGMRRDFIQNIVDERKANGPYTSFDQFLLRIDPRWLKVDLLEPLILIGAFDSLASNRRQLVVELEGKIKNVVYSGGSLDLLEVLALKEEELPDYPLEEKLAREDEYLGTYLSGHPTTEFPKIRRTLRIQDIADLEVNQAVRFLIYTKDIRTIRTKRGEGMAFVEGDDMTGEISLTLFPKLFRYVQKDVQENQVYYVEGKVEESKYNQEKQVLVEKIQLAAVVEAELAEETCYLRILPEQEAPDKMRQLQRLLKQHHGHVPVMLVYTASKKRIMLGEELWVTHSPELAASLQELLGIANVVFR